MNDGATKRKLLIIVYDRAVDEDLTETLKRLEIPGYTKLFDAHGFGGRGYKLGNPIFPGLNNILLIELPPERVTAVVNAVRQMQAQYTLKPGITIWCIDVEAMESQA
ncbi:MAG TPA: hypothetical protein EYP10_12525 [Armatimonadetes bacterium]|nr:hypothetical protein [Armatimonadota bacterium]